VMIHHRIQCQNSFRIATSFKGMTYSEAMSGNTISSSCSTIIGAIMIGFFIEDFMALVELLKLETRAGSPLPFGSRT
jgi:hypothetical protein